MVSSSGGLGGGVVVASSGGSSSSSGSGGGNGLTGSCREPNVPAGSGSGGGSSDVADKTESSRGPDVTSSSSSSSRNCSNSNRHPGSGTSRVSGSHVRSSSDSGTQPLKKGHSDVKLDHSADSASLKAVFENSPANQRRYDTVVYLRIKDTLWPAILSSVGRLSSSWRLNEQLLWERGPEVCPLLGGCLFLGGSFIRGSTVHTYVA